MERQPMWPELRYPAWKDTCTTLQLWTQIVGKIRLSQTPWLNHSWHTTLYLTARGLTTSPIPYERRLFQIYFDFIDHVLLIQVDDGSKSELPLRPQSVAVFESTVFAALKELGIRVTIDGRPNEVPDAIPFRKDTVHASYDADYAQRFWHVLLQSDRVFKHFRTGFLGKASPVHFFWGSFDLAVTRFSGRRAPMHPGGIPNLPDNVCREAYSHEVSSAGFWPGGGPTDYAAFYSYAYPAPAGFSEQPVQPAEAFFHAEAGEFVLPYDAVRTAADPDRTLLEFLQSTYEAAANTAGWDRQTLDCARGEAGKPRPYNCLEIG
ncbi:MAG TPA: DUF5996 family protein [Gammaproteobacteria bacterium]|nr:DUF5996 family protein [Gammaproteobacteria bacterium]